MAHDEYRAIADLYDHVVPYRTRTDIEFYVDAARESGGAVLELGCGTGRVLLPTARAGIAIAGLDLSSRMLEVCRDRLAAEPAGVQSRVELVEGSDDGFRFRAKFPPGDDALPLVPASVDSRGSARLSRVCAPPPRPGRPAGFRSIQSVARGIGEHADWRRDGSRA